jgi:sensor histidine kinase YesM
MQITANDVLTFLLILAVIMLIVVLYHLMFIAVNVRRISERVNDVSKELEEIIMTPLALIENSMTWITEMVMSLYGEEKEKKGRHGKEE